MQVLSTTLIVLVGVINTLPLVGTVSTKRLQSLYGVAIEDSDLGILMRHRAVLLGIVGGLLIASAFIVSLRPLGIGVGLVSMLSFVLIAWSVGNHNTHLRRVVIVDLVASVALGVAIFASVSE